MEMNRNTPNINTKMNAKPISNATLRPVLWNKQTAMKIESNGRPHEEFSYSMEGATAGLVYTKLRQGSPPTNPPLYSDHRQWHCHLHLSPSWQYNSDGHMLHPGLTAAPENEGERTVLPPPPYPSPAPSSSLCQRKIWHLYHHPRICPVPTHWYRHCQHLCMAALLTPSSGPQHAIGCARPWPHRHKNMVC